VKRKVHEDEAESVCMDSCSHQVHLLGGFQLRHEGRIVETLPTSERVIAFLALHDRRLPRAYLAASLWPDTTDEKANANLRTALWRLHGDDHDVVEIANSTISLRPDVWVDVRFVEAAARNHRLHGKLPGRELIDQMRGELLPGFWDSWLVFERERLRYELIHLFDLVGCDSLRRGDDHLAVLAALAALECDPLHESSNALLIRAYVAGGNRTDAVRAFRRYAASLRSELGVSPSDLMGTLLEGVIVIAPGTEVAGV
jgi:DNA-binding SARP family transcriptional activator